MSNPFDQLTKEIDAVKIEIKNVSEFLEHFDGKDMNTKDWQTFSYFNQKLYELKGERDLLQIHRANLERSIDVLCPLCKNTTSTTLLKSGSQRSTTRSQLEYSSPCIESPSISTATEGNLKLVQNSYSIKVLTIDNFQQFIDYFSQNKQLNNIVIPTYKWESSYEMPSYKTIFEHIEKYLLPERSLKPFTCQFENEFISVEVPSLPFYVFVGRVDGVVCDPDCDLSDTASLISFEIKRGNEVTELQSVMKLIGMIIKSQHPVLHILTDMDTFTFTICQVQQNGNKIFKYTSKSYCECKTIIDLWIKHANDMNNYLISQENPFHIKKIVGRILKDHQNPNSQIPQYFNVNEIKKEKTLCYSGLSSKQLEELNQLEDSILSQEYNVLSDKNRSGPVHKLYHQNKFLAFKHCYSYAIDHKGKLIINDLKNEKSIYDNLKDKQGPWPKLIYGGYIFNFNYYTIVTEFVEGRHPKQENEDDFKICCKSLKKLHECGIIHGDARPPNFIIPKNSNEACIFDFGFSKLMDDARIPEINEDFKKMKSKDGFNIDINENEI